VRNIPTAEVACRGLGFCNTPRLEASMSNKHDNEANDNNPRKQDDAKKGPGGGNSGAGRSGKEDMGSEKPETSPEFGSRQPGNS
jgi:hypothetical protein